MPGVTVHTATRSGPVNTPVPASGRYFVAGLTERGRTDAPERVRSLAEYEVQLGGRVTYGSVYDDLRTFFEEGGTEAYVARVVGPAATVGTRTLNDRAGAPLATLRIDALSAGAWSSGVTVQVAAGTDPSSYKLVIVGPTSQGGTVVETYDNLLTPSDGASALGASRFVRGTDLGSVTAGPVNNQPAILAASALTAGSDDRASVTAATVVTALARFGPELGAGVVAMPGYPSSSAAAGLKAHAKAMRRIYFTSVAVGASTADATTAANALVASDGEYGALLYPWVRIPVAGTTTKLISPEGYAAAMRARAHLAAGPWRAPAGELSVAKFVLGPEVELTRAQGDALDDTRVSAIRTIAGTTRLYGYRSLSSDVNNYALLIGRDVLNTVAYEAEARLEQYVFQTIDGTGGLLSKVAGTLVGLLDPMRAAGGLYERVIDGEQIDPGYSVDVGPTVNTVAVLGANTVAAVIALRVSPVGSLIDLTIVKAGLTATV